MLNGNARSILVANSKDVVAFDVVKVDEKDLSRPGFMLRILKSNKPKEVIFGTQSLEFQRFTFFIFLYLFLSLKFNGAVADEEGNILKFSLGVFIFKYLPLFIAEIIASISIVLYFYIKYPIKLWLMRRK